MSWQRSGITKETAGRAAYPAGVTGNALIGLVAEAGTLGKFTQGTCLRAYPPTEHTVAPPGGRLSAYPANVRPVAASRDARLGPVNVWGQPSSVMPCVLPENRAR